MEITIKRVTRKSEKNKRLVLKTMTGELYEYNGYQFCIGYIADFDIYRAIELQTGHSAAKISRNDFYPFIYEEVKEKIIELLKLHTKEEYDKYIRIAKENLEAKNFRLPINKKI